MKSIKVSEDTHKLLKEDIIAEGKNETAEQAIARLLADSVLIRRIKKQN